MLLHTALRAGAVSVAASAPTQASVVLVLTRAWGARGAGCPSRRPLGPLLRALAGPDGAVVLLAGECTDALEVANGPSLDAALVLHAESGHRRDARRRHAGLCRFARYWRRTRWRPCCLGRCCQPVRAVSRLDLSGSDGGSLRTIK